MIRSPFRFSDSARRLSLAASLFVLAGALAGCQQTTGGLNRSDPNRGQIALSQAVMAELGQRNMTTTSPVLMRIFKEEAELEVWKKDASGRYALFRTYPICNYSGELGPKVREGDRQSPEGFYTVTPAQMNAQSSFYLSFNLGFPNTFDRAHNRTGSHLMVHGDCSSRGCYAMTDEAIAEVYALAREALNGGQRSFQVQAYPFRMTPRNLARHRASPHMAFWRQLKEGHDHFEVTRLEPQVDVCERRYVFNAVSPGSELAGGPGRSYSQASSEALREMIAPNDPWANTRGTTASRAVVGPQGAVPTSVNRPVTTVAPVTRAAPARARITAISEDGATRPDFRSTERCPTYVVPAPIRQAVAAKNARDMAQVAALSTQFAAEPARTGIDGGTHQTFAARFQNRRIRVGATEPTFSLAAAEPTPLVSARSGSAPVQATARPAAPILAATTSTPVAAPSLASASSTPAPAPGGLASAPVPAPSPLRAVAASRPVETSPVQAFAPERTAPQAPPLAAASSLVARQPADAAPATTAGSGQPAAEPAQADQRNWFQRLIGTSPSPAAPAAAETTPGQPTAPVPLPRPQAGGAPVTGRQGS